MSFLLFIAFVVWEDVRRSFWLHSLIAIACHVGEFALYREACAARSPPATSWPCMVLNNVTSTSYHAGAKRSKVVSNIICTLAYLILLLKELSFLIFPVWMSFLSTSSTRIGGVHLSSPLLMGCPVC